MSGLAMGTGGVKVSRPERRSAPRTRLRSGADIPGSRKAGRFLGSPDGKKGTGPPSQEGEGVQNHAGPVFASWGGGGLDGKPRQEEGPPCDEMKTRPHEVERPGVTSVS